MKVGGRWLGEEVGLSFLGDNYLVYRWDVSNARIEDVCAESITRSQSAETDDEVRCSIREDHNTNREKVYLSVTDQSADKIDLKVDTYCGYGLAV
jgi:hypothetical protein